MKGWERVVNEYYPLFSEEPERKRVFLELYNKLIYYDALKPSERDAEDKSPYYKLINDARDVLQNWKYK
jgi:hypothetical protein